ncbi:MAG: hypothetical protein A3F84_19240 [Candidatus Handelsmanbacteria bacterium RIFCSPLOWO2_12_FULL_64_10]|uniref:Uroporphyrinogen decarboxylase (URO-D) domain-containing protein n=1 Tax=Handelsmanbacteria sp. (strain RIFCSPLOWO2_12_FULL_64_10) TaxID=1817868 RepID=A0A1F6CUZ6_HANXR|nr:MAG: hypothetical protein A3F84_19240 [Candidatus Handelsmanbacteria bacterium RIFCSPLOWO2_12_FULL_64_10]
MTPRERVRTALDLKAPDRAPIYESFFWATTLERWRGEGLPADADPYEYFGFDLRRLSVDTSFGFREQVLEETDEHVVVRTTDGGIDRRFKQEASERGVQHLSYPIETFEDWVRLRDHLRPEGRLTEWHIGRHARCLKAGLFLFYDSREPFWAALNKVGYEKFLMKFYLEPELIRDMLDAHERLVIGTFERAQRQGLRYDGAYFRSDIATVKGPILSPSMYREFILPCHRRLCAYFRDRGMPIMLHCDGNFNELIPLAIEAGFTAITPMEARTGMDVRVLKKQYGDRLAFMGNIDVDVMSAGDRAAIQEEVRSKTLIAKQGGGFIFHSDGSIPPTVSFQDFCYVIDIAREYGRY